MRVKPALALIWARLMSDYEVTLVNDSSKHCPTLKSELPSLRSYIPVHRLTASSVYVADLDCLVHGRADHSQARVLRPIQRSRRKSVRSQPTLHDISLSLCSTLHRRPLEDPRRAARPVPIQKSEHRLRQSDLSSEHR